MSSLSNGIQSATVATSGGAFQAATRSMMELGVASCIGAGCVHKELLDPTTISALSKTTFSILLPCFLGTSIIKTIAAYGLDRSSVLVPLLGIIQPFLLLQFAKYVLLPVFGIEANSEDGRCMAVCGAWGNTSVVPLIFCESLFRLSSDALTKSYAQISLFLVGWSPFFWSYGRSVLMGSGHTKSKASLYASVRRCAPPPVVGVLLGVIVATTPISRLFMPGKSNHKAPLLSVYNTIQNLGRAASPTSLLVMTSSLAIGAGLGRKDGAATKSAQNDKSESEIGFFRRWLCISVARFFISPCLMYGLLNGAERYGLVSTSKEEPMLWFVMMLQGAMPPAQNLVLMLNVADKASKSQDVAKFLFHIYFTSMIPVVLILSWALEDFGLV